MWVLRDQLDASKGPSDRPHHAETREGQSRAGAERLLDKAEEYMRQAAGNRDLRWRVGSWWNGLAYEGTLACLHAAEVAIIAQSAPARAWTRIDTVLALAGPLCQKDPRLTLVEELKLKDSPHDERVPWAVAALLEAAYAAQEERAVRSRNFRNRLIRSGSVLTVLLMVTVLVAWRSAGALPVCSDGCPRRTDPGLREVGLVMLLGMLGAATHVVGRLQKMGGSWNPYNLPFYQELIKLPIGALTAVIGLLLVDTEWLPMIKAPDSWRGVMAYAVVFGLSQIALTRTIDQRADKILASDPDPDEARQLENVPAPDPDPRRQTTPEFLT
ncbi:hypothetical protein [Streptomyces atriruber]|uniref:hypothetical protein n=1 Tax=Streptomyces atriruber TaxID=545121 RepID=UPI0006E304A1|nr:hypothetical protein [Streptomyces atriruber]